MFQIKAVEKIKTHILYLITFSENHAVYEIMSKNMVEPEKIQIIWHLRVAYCMSERTRWEAHARVRARTLTHPPPSPKTHTHTHTHRNV